MSSGAEALRKRQRAWELHQRGVAHEEIARDVGYSTGQTVAVILSNIRKDPGSLKRKKHVGRPMRGAKTDWLAIAEANAREAGL